MKVALYHNLPPGGALRTVREFVARAGPAYDCDVYTLDFGDADLFEPVDPGFERRDLSSVARQVRETVPDARRWLGSEGLERLSRLGSLRTAEKAVAAQINTQGYDVAYVHPCWASQTPSILADLTIPTVYFMQEVRRATFEEGYADRPGPGGVRGIPGWLASGLVERTERRRDIAAGAAADLVLANSRYSGATVERCYGLHPRVTHLGVDTDAFQTTGTRSGDGADADRAYVVSVGGLEEFKGAHLVVEALSLLPAEARPELDLVYERRDEGYRERLLAQAASTGVAVREHPGISDVELARLYRSARATVVAARLEPLGLVPLESIACGTPVVATCEGGYLETVQDGLNGLLVDRSPAALSDAITRILCGEIPGDAEAVRQTILPYWSLDSSVRRQVEALTSVASAGPPPT